jgi:hypothetical protein
MNTSCLGRSRPTSLDRAGHPTRATKVEWLCLAIGNDEYRAFVRTELDSTLALINMVDSGLHVDEFPEFEQSYRWVMLRVEMALRLMLATWKLRSA